MLLVDDVRLARIVLWGLSTTSIKPSLTRANKDCDSSPSIDDVKIVRQLRRHLYLAGRCHRSVRVRKERRIWSVQDREMAAFQVNRGKAWPQSGHAHLSPVLYVRSTSCLIALLRISLSTRPAIRTATPFRQATSRPFHMGLPLLLCQLLIGSLRQTLIARAVRTTSTLTAAVAFPS